MEAREIAILENGQRLAGYARDTVQSHFKVQPNSSLRRGRLVPSRVNGPFLDETEGISPGIQRIERSLAPRAHDDAAAGCVVNLLTREAVQGLGSLIYHLQIADCEVKRLSGGVGLTFRRDVEDLQGDSSTFKIAA